MALSSFEKAKEVIAQLFAAQLRVRHPPATRRAPRMCWLGAEPQRTQVTPFCHQMGCRATIWDIGTGILRRIPAQISPWRPWALNPNILFIVWDPKMQGLYYENGFHALRTTISK